MRLAVPLLLLLAVVCAPVSAQVPADSARQLFDEGVALGQEERWADAADRFERSLAFAERPGTRFNLVNAYVQLGRPLDVARHALAFLALPPEPHRAEARTSAEQALEDAARELAILGTQSIPAGTVLRIDGQEPEVRDATRVFVLPGLHRLEALVPGATSEVIELQLSGGQELAWPRQGRAERIMVPAVAIPEETAVPAPPMRSVAVVPDDVPQAPLWRSRLSIVTGTLGASLALTSVGLYALALSRAHQLRRTDPYAPGFLRESDDYLQLTNAIAPLAAAGGVLMAQAVATGPRSARWGWRTTAWVGLAGGAALLAGAVTLLVRSPDQLGSTQLVAPSRQAGALLAAGAAPLLSYGASFLVHFHRSPRGVQLQFAGAPR